MHLESIYNLARFDALGPAWDHVYARDRHAHVFLSRAWLRSWLEIAPDPWVILALRSEPDLAPVGFLPLSLRQKRIRGWPVAREVRLGGKPFASFTGLLCLPEHEPAALSALASYLANPLAWDTMRLEEVMDPRFSSLLDQLPEGRFETIHGQPLPCPFIPLPTSWEAYLQDFLSYKRRRTLRRAIRMTEELDGFRSTHPDPETLDLHIEKLLQLWQLRWGNKSEAILREYRHMYGRAHKEDRLWLHLLWAGEDSIAGLAAFVDPVTRSLSAYTTGYDPRFDRVSPGSVVMAYGIRHAIEVGFRTFDFLEGGHDYKFDYFSAQTRFAERYTVFRRSLRSRMGRRLVEWSKRMSR